MTSTNEHANGTLADATADRIAQSAPKPKDGAPALVRMASVRPELVRWLWPGRIALGKLSLLIGDPGVSKSTLTMDLAARVSTGGAWPDAQGSDAGGVVILNAEDGIADTVRPRLDRHGADVDRIVAMTGVHRGDGKVSGFSLEDVRPLARAIDEVEDCRLVVIDPVSAFLGRTDSHVNAEVRGLLAELARLAETKGVAMLAVTHLSKGGNNSRAIYRAMGSLAFIAAARAAWAVVNDPDDDERRLFLPVKNNLAPNDGGLAYSVREGRIEWQQGAVSNAVDDVLGAADGGDSSQRAEREEAIAFLLEELHPGALPARKLEARARDAGISNTTLRRAKKELGIIARKAGFDGGWVWSLPEDAHPSKHKTVSAFAKGERLGDFEQLDGGESTQSSDSKDEGAHRQHVGEAEHLGDGPEFVSGGGA